MRYQFVNHDPNNVDHYETQKDCQSWQDMAIINK